MISISPSCGKRSARMGFYGADPDPARAARGVPREHAGQRSNAPAGGSSRAPRLARCHVGMASGRDGRAYRRLRLLPGGMDVVRAREADGRLPAVGAPRRRAGGSGGGMGTAGRPGGLRDPVREHAVLGNPADGPGEVPGRGRFRLRGVGRAPDLPRFLHERDRPRDHRRGAPDRDLACRRADTGPRGLRNRAVPVGSPAVPGCSRPSRNDPAAGGV